MSQIHEKIPLIMAEVGHVGKDKKNAQQGYAYRGIDDVMASLQSIMAKHGVHARPLVKDWRCDQVEIGAKGSRMFHVIGVVEYHLGAADGSEVVSSVIAEATDSADKAGNKAMASALKYALTQTFCIPTEEAKDTELDHHELAQARPAAPAQPAPPPVKPASGPVRLAATPVAPSVPVSQAPIGPDHVRAEIRSMCEDMVKSGYGMDVNAVLKAITANEYTAKDGSLKKFAGWDTPEKVTDKAVEMTHRKVKGEWKKCMAAPARQELKDDGEPPMELRSPTAPMLDDDLPF